MKATITKDHLAETDDEPDLDEVGRVFIYGNTTASGVAHAKHRKFKAYDDDGELYYELDAEIGEDVDLGDLLMQLGSYAGVTRLDDVTGDGEDWSAS